MHISSTTSTTYKEAGDLLVVGIYQAPLREDPAFVALDAALGGALASEARACDFTGACGQQLQLAGGGALKVLRLVLVGLGAYCSKAAPCAATWLRLGGTATRLGNRFGARQVLLAQPQPPSKAAAVDLQLRAAQLARGVHLGAYAYRRYRTARARPHTVQKVVLLACDKASQASAATLRTAAVVAEGVALVRDLVNQPANDLYPKNFAQLCVRLAKAQKVACTVHQPPQLKKMGARLLLAVGEGSERPPCMVHLRYTPTAAASRRHGRGDGKPVVLVGKGITFDTGGLSLKAPDKMFGMKMDMGGAATVLASVLAAAKLQLPVPVHGILALAENMPSGHATRPGDIVASAAGKTVEINNTDAEGRLVLADALHLAGQQKARCIVDYATLTGACMVALGPTTAGLFANSDGLAADLLQAAGRTGEDFWRLPLTPALREQLQSEVADLRNTGEAWGGAITAALFLQEFVGEVPWAHLDIAGPATGKIEAGAASKGGTGVAVAATVDFLSRQATAHVAEWSID